MVGVYRVPRHGSLLGTSDAAGLSESAVPQLETWMKRISGTLLAIVAVGACAASASALADNPAGFYLGAGVGYSTIRSDDSAYGLPGYFNDHQTAWKAIAGVRPIPFLGAEFEYIDFGHPSHDYGNYNSINYYGFDSHPRASALFGVGYLPLPIPFVDVYAKAGVARLQTDVTTIVNSCPAGLTCAQSGCLHPSRANVQPVRLRRRRAVQILGCNVSCRVRAHQLSVRRPRRFDGQRHGPDRMRFRIQFHP